MNTKSEKDIVKSLYIKVFILATIVTLIFAIIIGYGMKKRPKFQKSYLHSMLLLFANPCKSQT